MDIVNKKLLEILVCPKCKARVKQSENKLVCTNPVCGLGYPVRDGIPVMLIEEAEPPADKLD